MSRLRQNRLVLQLLFTLIAAASLAGISIVIITDAIRNVETVVVGEAKETLKTAVKELKQQQAYRALSDPSWSSLPKEARNVSLRGITNTVLRSYPGIEGGFYAGKGVFLGYAYPTHDTGASKTDVPAAESGLIAKLAQQSLSAREPIAEVIRGSMDLLVLTAVRSANPTTAIWAMKRLPGRAHSNNAIRVMLLGILVAASLVSVAGALTTGIGLARGVAQIRNGLATLEKDFDFQLPVRQDELGTISRAINRMASVRRKLEADLRREDRLRALGRLAAGLAHEIRNPLNSIRLTVQLLEHRLKSGRLGDTDLQTVQSEVDRLNTLVNDLLDLQRTRQPVLKFQPVLPTVEHCLMLLHRQAEMQGVRFHLAPMQREVCAFFDAQQLTQTVMNLLLNALEVSKEDDLVNVSICEQSGAVTLEVRDNGPGLDVEQQDHLFEPFYTTKPSGGGLGLAVSRELMRSQGGDLSYTATTQGACFVVHLRRT
jgi:signal transduction histidine kinase